jgi:hypothetical protein
MLANQTILRLVAITPLSILGAAFVPSWLGFNYSAFEEVAYGVSMLASILASIAIFLFLVTREAKDGFSTGHWMLLAASTAPVLLFNSFARYYFALFLESM